MAGIETVLVWVVKRLLLNVAVTLLLPDCVQVAALMTVVVTVPFSDNTSLQPLFVHEAVAVTELLSVLQL